MPSQGARIPRKAYELPLLKSLVELGGSTKLSKQLYDIVAEKITFDKNSLFSLFYAFMRRFGFVHINNPSNIKLHNIIDGRVKDGHLNTPDSEKIKRLLNVTPRELGPAILLDILNYIKERNSLEAFFESVVAYVIPQLEGLAVEAIIEFFNRIAKDLGDEEHQGQVKQYLTELFEIEVGVWETSQYGVTNA